MGIWRRITYTYADGQQIILDGEARDEKLPYLEGTKGKLYPGFKSDISDLERKLAAFPEHRFSWSWFASSIPLYPHKRFE